MRNRLIRFLVIFLVLSPSILAPITSTVPPVLAAQQTLHSFYFSGIRPGRMFQVSDISINRDLYLNSLTQVTLEAWVKRVNASRNETVVCNDYGSSYCLSFTGSKVFFRTNNGASSEVLSTANVEANYWVHIAGAYANGVSRIYVNGILDTSAAYRPKEFRSRRSSTKTPRPAWLRKSIWRSWSRQLFRKNTTIPCSAQPSFAQ
ncbi:MAG TPA: LamG-like jellyroll fold domain-containing protein [Anaerolineaceae bacterium]|nr:LamG-like jellyroll fold domain-containing protein [Anaerolineaceae bacterium]